MLKLTRLLILVSVAILAARPVMACCLTGHNAPAALEVQNETPPCHGEAPDTDEANTINILADRGLSDCPGCSDCDTAMIQTHTADDGALLTQPPTETPVAALAARFVGFELESIVLKTGPPDDPSFFHYTPITLKQRLLI